MTNFLPRSVRVLIEELGRLPGIGQKSAQRLAIHLLHTPDSRVKPLGEAIINLRNNVMFCRDCWNIAETDPCGICGDEARDKSAICVVEDVLDVVALEKTREFKGVYHVLHGVLSPINGVGPDQLKMEELFARVTGGLGVREVILATNPSLEGEATALYIQKRLLTEDVKLTRIARGLPVGGDVEYADEITLSRALRGRGEF
jgi:recombination protein RecR